MDDSNSSDDVPLAKKVKKTILEDDIPLSVLQNKDSFEQISDQSSISTLYDSDKDPEFCGQCEHSNCVNNIFEICDLCEIYFCEYHHTNHNPCYKNKTKKELLAKTKSSKVQTSEGQISKKGTTATQVEKTANQLSRHNIHDDESQYRSCEAHGCIEEDIFAACPRCPILLCWDHFNNYENCNEHYITPTVSNQAQMQCVPEDFIIEGCEDHQKPPKSPRKNKKQLAKVLRNQGKEYLSTKSKNVIPKRSIKPTCNTENCKRLGKGCYKIEEEGRLGIFFSYYDLGSLQLQRELITRHTEIYETKQKTTKDESRRKQTYKYFLTHKNEKFVVCKKFFLNTLDISERTVRTALSKITETGMVEPEKRGGRQSETVRALDARKNKLAEDHIDRFPYVESHYCRASSNRNYLHEELSLPKMYSMFRDEHKHIPAKELPLFTTYRRVFKKKNLSFHRPKKDQCSLCMSYKKGDAEEKARLKEQYQVYTLEKEQVRKIKAKCKDLAKNDPTHLCAVFDLQQVIHLPITKESALFYKRRLAVYNFTVYNVATKEVFCYTWDETQSKRGSSEMSTAVYAVLSHYDDQGVKSVSLFCDGCPGQNKNSILPTMLLYFVSRSQSITEISLRYFEPYHGQSEGDSCHSAITYAVSKAGDIFVPSQLHPVFHLARRVDPYKVIPLQYNDFLDFKGMSVKLRILQERDIKGKTEAVVDWTKMAEVKVSKNERNEIKFKTSHLQEVYYTIELKRQKRNLKDVTVELLNQQPLKVSKPKYNDLNSLCKGNAPVIRLPEHKKFYQDLPHDV